MGAPSPNADAAGPTGAGPDPAAPGQPDTAADTALGGSARLLEVARLFGRLGLLGFGGPAAHIALLREEFVRRRAWLTDAEFLDLVGVSNLIPGPTSTELAIHIGHRRAGLPGLVVAGLAFIAPAVVIVLGLAWAVVAFGARPEVGAIGAGIGPVVVAIVAWAGYGLGRTALRRPRALALALASVAGVLAGVPEILLLLGLGVASLLVVEGARARWGRGRAALALGLSWSWPPVPGSFVAVGPAIDVGAFAAAAVVASPPAILVEFLRIGVSVFGSGYVLVAFLRAELVERLGWLTEHQLLDAIAAGQATPGPLFTSATFAGYVLAGVPGALAATVGIFLPAFVAVGLSLPAMRWLATSARARAFLDGVNAAAVGLLAVVALQLAQGAITDPVWLAVGGLSLLALARGVSAPPLILAGAGVGVARWFVSGA